MKRRSFIGVLVALVLCVPAVASRVDVKGPYLKTYGNQGGATFWQWGIWENYPVEGGTPPSDKPAHKMFVYRRGATVNLPSTPIFNVTVDQATYADDGKSATFSGVYIARGMPVTIEADFVDGATDTITYTVTGPDDVVIYKSPAFVCHPAVTKFKATAD